MRSRPLPAVCRNRAVGVGGTTDVAFIGGTAYALVTLVGPDVSGTPRLYRIDGPDSFTVVADIGAFAEDNPPEFPADPFPFDVLTGVQYALETYRGEFLVTDGHHNRVYRVTRAGEVSVLIQFGNIVPTGLETSGNTIYMAEAGPVPHDPADGKVVSFKPKSPSATEVASGAPPGIPPHSSSTWSSAAVAISTPSRRAASVAVLPVLRRRRTQAAS